MVAVAMPRTVIVAEPITQVGLIACAVSAWHGAAAAPRTVRATTAIVAAVVTAARLGAARRARGERLAARRSRPVAPLAALRRGVARAIARRRRAVGRSAYAKATMAITCAAAVGWPLSSSTASGCPRSATSPLRCWRAPLLAVRLAWSRIAQPLSKRDGARR